MSDEKLDFIIFGATGVTGRFALRNMILICKNEKKNYTFGIAGRSKGKLDVILRKIASDLAEENLDKRVRIFEADVKNRESLLAMTRSCRVLISTVGPYSLYGRPVVECCIESGTHYVDVSGEPDFLENIHVDLNEQAKAKGVYIVNSCGFDSIPADVGLLKLKDTFKDIRFNEVENFGFFKDAPGKPLNHGTWDSLIYSVVNWTENLRSKIRVEAKYFTRPYEYRVPLKLKLLPRIGPMSGKWTIPFWETDSRVVRRTQMINYAANPEDYPVQLNSYMGIPNLFVYFVLVAFLPFVLLASLFPPTRRILLNYPDLVTFGKVSSQGPTDLQIAQSSFKSYLVGKGWKKNDPEINRSKPNTIRMVEISGPEVAYDSTSIFLNISAITILEDLITGHVQVEAGILTPGLAFRNSKLIERLVRNGIEFKVIENNL